MNIEGRGVRTKIPLVLYSKLSEKFTDAFFIQDAWKTTTKNALIQIATEIRSRLLDLVLELEGKIPKDLNESELKIMAKEINTKALFNHTIFVENATILLGNNNTQSVYNSIVKNDFESLAKYFEDKNISHEDIKALKKAKNVDHGSSNHNEQQFGPNVKKLDANNDVKSIRNNLATA